MSAPHIAHPRRAPWAKTAACSLAGLVAVGLTALSAAADTIAIVGGRTVTNADGGIIENGIVIVEDGRITAVGEADALTAPADARVIDAAGAWVTPGLFAPAGEIGLVEISLESSANDSRASDSGYSVALRIADGFNPRATTIPVTRVEGVTRIALTPSPGSEIFAGIGALADLSGGPDSVFEPNAFAHAAFGEAGARLAGGNRSASWAYFRAALEDARGFPARFMTHKEGDALDRYDARALGPFARGERPILVAMNRESDLRRLIDLSQRDSALRFIVIGGAEAHAVAEELAGANIPVILDPSANLPGSFDTIGASARTALALEAAGVTYAFSTATSGYSHEVRLLPQHAGVAVTYGLSWDAAFRAITLGPAQIYGVADQLGSLEPGKIADVVVWDGDPLEVMSAPTAVLINGEETNLETRQTKLRDRYLGIAEAPRAPAYRLP